jgi:starch synthase (maltosyl-transferring)
VREHPEWFKHRPDGTIQYAENPPKKYQDIYPFDFECEQWESLWLELESIFEFWIEHGVRVFRVDNPHTKSLRFWAWCIPTLLSKHPDLVFLAEAFTRPKVMYQLAKAGFSQSYTYFTWRNSGPEFIAYMHELTRTDVREFCRPNFWPNTPDILPEHLQFAGRSAFELRLLLAGTLSSNYGIYGPAFEQMANRPREGVEEYADNEKYEIKHWAAPSKDDLCAVIAKLNAIRNDNPALQFTDTVRFHATDNEMLLCFSKRAPDDSNAVLVVVNLDVHHAQSGWVSLDLRELGVDGPRAIQMHDLWSDERYLWSGTRNYVRLDPARAAGHVFRVRRYVRTEHDFDYFA